MKERNFFRILTYITIGLIAIGLASVALFAIELYKNGRATDNLFEMVAFSVYMIIMVFSLVLCIKAITYKSTVIKALMYVRGSEKTRSRPASIIAIVFGSISLVLFVYFLLALFIKTMPVFNFPIVLIYMIVNVSLTILIYSIFFFLYPNVKDDEY